MKNDKYELYTLGEKEVKRQKTLKIVSILLTALSFIGAIVLIVVGLYLKGWDFAEFLKTPALSFGAIILIIVAVALLGYLFFKKGNNDYGGK